ncbi:membrane-associating domain-containing protein [Chaetomium strumarium]|uniref:Membrane-associating domain-containing protein n=1 Tax=Chaetomium strumarium TaxID=1170767 RepID=A0AAJ0H0H7_9PEZI|nr:membrane-associating domain-containing protein [Chaetomium strumarium]
MILADLVSIILRLAELAFAAIVAGLNGDYLHSVTGTSSWHLGRFIYTEVVAGLAILLAIIWLFPFSGSFIHWPVDFVISVAWFVAFGLLVDWLDDSCGDVFDWDGINFNGTASCAQWKAVIAFSFLSAICWLVSAILGIYWVRRHTAPAAGGYHRRRWYRSRV